MTDDDYELLSEMETNFQKSGEELNEDSGDVECAYCPNVVTELDTETSCKCKRVCVDCQSHKSVYTCTECSWVACLDCAEKYFYECFVCEGAVCACHDPPVCDVCENVVCGKHSGLMYPMSPPSSKVICADCVE